MTELSRDAEEVLSIVHNLAPGVVGYTVDDDDGALYIPVIAAEKPGSGDVGRYLDSLPRDRTIKVPAVINPRLRGMLERRGFKPEMEYASELDEDVEVFKREAIDATE